MEFQTTFHNHSNDELAKSLLELAEAQNNMAAKTGEDFTFWHHVVVSDALFEAAKRLRGDV